MDLDYEIMMDKERMKGAENKSNTEFEQRVAIIESDYRLESLKAASKLPNIDLVDMLTNADRIEKWLNEPKVIAAETRRRNWEEQKKIMQKLSEKM